MHIKNLCQTTFSIHTIRSLYGVPTFGDGFTYPKGAFEYTRILFSVIYQNQLLRLQTSLLLSRQKWSLIAFRIRFRVYGLGRGSYHRTPFLHPAHAQSSTEHRDNSSPAQRCYFCGFYYANRVA